MNARRVLLLCTTTVVLSLFLASCVIAPIQAPAEQAPAAATAAPASEVAEWVAPEDALISVPVDAAPTLDGVADEAFWAEAPAISVEMADGANMGESVMNLQSVYSGDMVYFLATWADPTESFIRSPWVKQDDGSWAKLKDPDDKGGDNNVYYEDKMSIIWPIGESIPRFKGMGCYTACHDGENPDVKPYGNKYTEEEGQMGDIWHWKSVRNLGQIDDQYLDWTRYSADTPGAGRKSDPKDSGGYADNQTEDKKLPMHMGPEGSPKDGSPGYILDAEKQPFEDAQFAAGDMIPSIVISAMVGDRGDIAAGWQWADGVWTLEFGRKLVTGSEFDVQFDDLAKPYYFGVAAFDNAQVRHAYQESSTTLVFQP